MLRIPRFVPSLGCACSRFVGFLHLHHRQLDSCVEPAVIRNRSETAEEGEFYGAMLSRF